MINDTEFDELVSSWTKIPQHEIFALTSRYPLDHADRPIVLIHGAIASRRYMIPTAKLLTKNFRVLLPDLPGHGLSSKPEHALTVQQHADAIRSWLDKLEIERASFLANSYGCQIVSQFAVSYPKSVDKLILTDPTGDPNAISVWQQFFRLMQDGFVEPMLAPFMVVFDIWDMGVRRTSETVHQMNEDNIRNNLPKIQAPTLVVRGENDCISPQDWCEEVTRLIPDASLKVIPDAPHSVNSATAEQLCQLVNDFALFKTEPDASRPRAA